MSEKKRQKKDGERKDKKNQAMHDTVNSRRQQADQEGQASGISNPGAGSNRDRERPSRSER